MEEVGVSLNITINYIEYVYNYLYRINYNDYIGQIYKKL